MISSNHLSRVGSKLKKLFAEDEKIEGVPVRFYTPKGASGKLPVGIFTHSGGFCCGGLDQEDFSCRLVAKATPCILISVDYPLGPDHKQPEMFNSVLAVYKWVSISISINEQNARNPTPSPLRFVQLRITSLCRHGIIRINTGATSPSSSRSAAQQAVISL